MKSGLFDDAPVYLGQCLPNDRKVYGVILFASWSLTNIERRYSQKKKEALALVWTCERFSMCMSDESFELETDHKPLEPIHSRSSKPCARIERWVLCLQAKIIEAIFPIFARFGVLFSLRRGNGAQLILEDLESFFPVHDN